MFGLAVLSLAALRLVSAHPIADSSDLAVRDAELQERTFFCSNNLKWSWLARKCECQPSSCPCSDKVNAVRLRHPLALG